jgi:REP element-mobilizing transposase RayT
MPRANRHYIPRCVWHITHRCHKKEFLLKFAKDRKRCLQWLFEAKKRYELRILNYMVTSNHVHLLLYDSGGRDMIPKSVQLVAGRTGQQYNQRKRRKGLAQRCVLGRSVSCYCRGTRCSPISLSCLYRSQYGSSRRGNSPLGMALQRTWRDSRTSTTICVDLL